MLITEANLADPDDVYAQIISAHDGLTEAESHALNARLILLLINQIGDGKIIALALQAARRPEAEALA